MYRRWELNLGLRHDRKKTKQFSALEHTREMKNHKTCRTSEVLPNADKRFQTCILRTIASFNRVETLMTGKQAWSLIMIPGMLVLFLFRYEGLLLEFFCRESY
ncbi:uncharacterized protein LOC143667403 isoform X2 [Tamandua tetradactyla]|uniref:uncharacterized protein LOC143667403 isoform X2 n=1 Tax=Tamandua tetradactyla TaxID=48850 RepID=UPI0040546E47